MARFFVRRDASLFLKILAADDVDELFEFLMVLLRVLFTRVCDLIWLFLNNSALLCFFHLHHFFVIKSGFRLQNIFIEHLFFVLVMGYKRTGGNSHPERLTRLLHLLSRRDKGRGLDGLVRLIGLGFLALDKIMLRHIGYFWGSCRGENWSPICLLFVNLLAIRCHDIWPRKYTRILSKPVGRHLQIWLQCVLSFAEVSWLWRINFGQIL